MATATGVRGSVVPLLVIATAQLTLVLDDSIVNIALLSIQRELGVPAVHLPWVVNSYILAFGALGITIFVVASLFSNRNRAGAYLVMLLLATVPMGTFYVLTSHLQQVLRFSPLPPRTGPRNIATLGALLGAAAAGWFSIITVSSSYWLHLAPAMLLLALGFGLGVLALTQPAVDQRDPDNAGIASALLNSAQQVGVALGLALLAGIAATSTARTGVPITAEALVAGYSSALAVAAGLLALAAAVALVTFRARPHQRGAGWRLRQRRRAEGSRGARPPSLRLPPLLPT